MSELDEETSEAEEIVRQHIKFLTDLGVSPIIALEFGAVVDHHEVAKHIRRGCPPDLAVEIER